MLDLHVETALNLCYTVNRTPAMEAAAQIPDTHFSFTVLVMVMYVKILRALSCHHYTV